MNTDEIIKLGAKMREAQKKYFRFRSTSCLNAAKKLEKAFDKALFDYFNPNNQLCFEDFNLKPSPLMEIPLDPLTP